MEPRAFELVTGQGDASGRDAADCARLWTAAVADRDGRVLAGTAERIAAKFAEPPVAWRLARASSAQPSTASTPLLGFSLLLPPDAGAASPSDPRDAAYLALLGTYPSAQGQGVASALLRQLATELPDAGYRRAVLHVLRDNAAAIRLYERHGWRSTGAEYEHPVTARPMLAYLLDLG